MPQQPKAQVSGAGSLSVAEFGALPNEHLVIEGFDSFA